MTTTIQLTVGDDMAEKIRETASNRQKRRTKMHLDSEGEAFSSADERQVEQLEESADQLSENTMKAVKYGLRAWVAENE